MSFNATVSSYSSALNVQATPTRDRDRLPFPQSSHPSPAPSLRQTGSSSTSASFTNLPSTLGSNPTPVVQVSPQTITVDALLRQHASSPDPTAAALEQAVTDRNVLSSQNTQLWKLIEKQRTGYNQILKELERIRGERDSYKSRLSALNALPNGTSDKRQKTGSERGSKPSLDAVSISSHMSTNSTSHTHTQSRQTMSRHNSEDTATPRNLHHPLQLHASRSFDPIGTRPNDNKTQSNVNDLAIILPYRSSSPSPGSPLSTQTATPTARQNRPSPAPLVVTNPADTLSAYTISNSPESSASTKPLDIGGDTTTNNVTPNGINSFSSTRPLVHPRKASLADSVSSILTSGSSTSSTSSPLTSGSSSTHNFGSNPNTPSQQQYYSGTPYTTSAGLNATSLENSFARSRGLVTSAASPASNQPPPILTSPPNATPSPLSQPPVSQSQVEPQGQMLSASVDGRPHLLSRDSRISLPDEASRYIQNMGESPVASPRVETFSPKSKLSSSVFPPISNGTTESGRESEFLDMEEEDDSEEGSEDGEGAGDTTIGADPVLQPPNDSVAPFGQDNNTKHGSDNYPAYQYPQPDFMNNYSSQSNSSREDVDLQGKRKEKSRVGAEEFPLPPPSNIYMQRQQGSSGQEVQPQLYAQNPPQGLQVQPSLSASAPSPSKLTQAIGDRHHSSSPHRPSQESHAPMPESLYQNQQPPISRSESSTQKQEQANTNMHGSTASFRALPLLSSDLPHTTINVSHSFVRPNDRGKEVLSFIVFVNPGHGKDGWKVEKMYSDVLNLDQRVRSSVGKGVGKKIVNLPEGKLWKDHAPAKVDQRKAVLENYLQTLIQLPVKNNDEVIAFFTSDIVREQKQAVMQVGHKEGYLTKKGKNFGGWKTRFFVLQGPILEYYDCRGGAHLGSITITGAQIARQHRTERPPNTDDETEYRHAFLIVESKKGPGGNHPRHVLCAESDDDRDSWVEMLVRYYTGTYSEDLVFNPSSGLTSVQNNSVAALSQQNSNGQPRSSMSSIEVSTPRSKAISRGVSRDDIVTGSAVPISLLPPDAANAKLLQSGPSAEDYLRSSSPSRSVDPSPIDRQGPSAAGGFDISKRMMDRSLGLPSSLPDSSPLSNAQTFQPEGSGPGQRANSELGHYPDLQDARGANRNQRQQSPEQYRPRDDGRKSFYPTLNTVSSSPTTAVPQPDRVPSPEKFDAAGKVKISGPMNGAPIPSGFKFGGKDAPSADPAQAANDRREKAKSRSFWGFGKANGDKSQLHAAYPPRAVFGVSLEEALDVAQICNLPAIVFRSIQYLEAKKADQEEGIYRLSGSSAVIKNLKDMFNNEGDIDLLASDEYWDPHAIAGLLKSFLRELPSSILTRDLHLRFLAVIDFVDPQERIKELSQLISALPLANYTLLRALTAHLILIVQNSHVNKMTMRNVGIVFSPTLGIPAGVFSLMLGEFNRVFNVDADNDEPGATDGDEELENLSEPLKRNSRQYSDAAADQVLGLAGRTLKTSAEENQSDGDDFSIQDESGTETTEGDVTVESSSSSPTSTQKDHNIRIYAPDTTNTPTPARTSKAATAAASRGLNVAVAHSDRGNRHSRMMGLPSSPRPSTHSPSHSDIPIPITDTTS